MKRKYLLALATLSVAILITAASCSNGAQQQQIESLASCLADKGVKEYGAFWCPHCAEQKKIFGGAYEILASRDVYIECDPRCVPDERGKLQTACRGEISHSDECLEKEINGYPTWIFPDGKRLSGVQQPAILAQASGCEFQST